jgi:hypothetical protein
MPKRAGFVGFNTPPEFTLGGDYEMLMKRIGMGFDLDRLATTSDNRWITLAAPLSR